MNARPDENLPRAVLLLRLEGPMQSWGVTKRKAVRDTLPYPTNSGVIGLCAAALGRGRHVPLDDLAALEMGVRVDRPGVVQRDFQTAQNVARADGTIKPTETSERYYLSDALFLIALAGDAHFLSRLHPALLRPHFPLCLGRKAFPPAKTPWLPDGFLPGSDIATALRTYRWLGRPWESRPKEALLVLEEPEGDEELTDKPLGAFSDRRFTTRRVAYRYAPLPPEGA